MRRALSGMLLSAFVALLASACTTEDGTTPACTQDITGDPPQNQHMEGGCNPFAACLDENGKVAPAATCCAGVLEKDRDSCLRAYGEIVSTSGGTGGAGGGS